MSCCRFDLFSLIVPRGRPENQSLLPSLPNFHHHYPIFISLFLGLRNPGEGFRYENHLPRDSSKFSRSSCYLRPQFIFLVLEINHDIEFWLTILALPTSLMMLFLGTLSADHEWVWGMVSMDSFRQPALRLADVDNIAQSIFMVSQFPGMGYFVYKILRIWQQRSGVYAQIYKVSVRSSLIHSPAAADNLA